MEDNHKEYEIAFLAREEKDAQAVLQTLIRLGGRVSSEGPLEKIALAYPIQKETHAYFGYLHFSFDPHALEALSRELEVGRHVLRFLIITPPFGRMKTRLVAEPRRSKPFSPPAPRKAPAPLPLSNEALEKKIEEILQ